MVKNNYTYSIVPEPVRYEENIGVFHLDNMVSIYSDPRYMTQAKALQKSIRNDIRYDLKIADNSNRDRAIKIIDSPDIKHPEGYLLKITDKNIIISASTDKGIFYGTQTLRQVMMQSTDTKLKSVTIKDYPRFEWRGLHIDVSRHFFPVSFILKLLDLMSFYKLNRFHWHLTDDQGWRIEIKKYPELIKTGAYRKQKDGSIYGGYYSKEEIKKVISYADKLHIEIIPEIEMPGHSRAAIASYPELSCRGEKIYISNKWGISENVFCAGKENVFEFLENVLSEVIDLFPGEYVHIGGDECPKERWKNCSDCQRRIEQEGLRDEYEMQSYFIKRIISYLKNRGKKAIGWDEIMEGGLAKDAILMIWRGDGIDTGKKAVALGNDIIYCPNPICYLDWKQTSTDKRGAFGVTTIGKIYDYEPVPEGMSEGEAKRIMGLQGNIWTEQMGTEKIVEYMAFPRTLAIAETCWSLNKRNWDDFAKRVKVHLETLKEMGVNCCRDIER
ncbi:MAG: beta-N-acetylhexosaminidase [Actinomycetota bacterium]|nr:beta-N-acetylhexosaminidase [Actinomycetota bacterium]